MSRRYSVGIAVAAALALSACFPLLGMQGQLHDRPSSGADLPFASDGVYVVDGGSAPCEEQEPGVSYDPRIRCTRCRFMAFHDDGTFVIAGSEAAVRNPMAVRSRHGLDGLDAERGNYRVDGGRVDARAVGPGGTRTTSGSSPPTPSSPRGRSRSRGSCATRRTATRRTAARAVPGSGTS